MVATKSIQRLVFVLLLTLSFVTAMPGIFTEPAKAQPTNVTISDLAFNPKNVTIEVGSSITWINNDPLIYTLWFVKADDGTTYQKAGTEGLSDPILPDTSWSQNFSEVVTLQYYSFERLWITGFITVVPIHDIAVTSITPSPTNVTSGENLTITVDVENEGTVAENFTVTVYSNNTAIDTQNVTNLTAGSSETLDFIWDTTNATEGKYVISAEASQVTGETDTADNTRTAEVMVTVKEKVQPFIIFPYIGIALIIIAIIVIGVGAYIYIKRKRISET